MGSGGFGGSDPQFPFARGRVRLADDEVDVAAERGQKPPQQPQRVRPGIVPERRREAEQPPRFGAGEAAPAEDGVDPGDRLGLDEMRLDVRGAEVGEDVAAAWFDSDAGPSDGSALIDR